MADTKKFIGAFLCEPEVLKGRSLCSARGFWSMDEIADTVGRIIGKRFVYK